MIKSLKTAILVFLVLNLLAMLAGIGWVVSSGRVNKDRVMEVTKLFSEPVAVEQARLKAEETAAEEAEAAKPRALPAGALNTEERNMLRVEVTQVDMARLERMKREVEDLQNTLRTERKGLADDRVALENEKAEFEAMRKRLQELEGGIQFQKALATISGMEPKDAKSVLTSLLETSDKYEEVVSYLSAMDDRKRTAVMTEFVKGGEEELAGDLLEAVRLRGLETTTADGTTP